MEMPRVVTNKEIFEEHFVKRWIECLAMAYNVLSNPHNVVKMDIPLSWEALLAGTATLYISRNQNEGYIAKLRNDRQKEVDMACSFNKPVKGV